MLHFRWAERDGSLKNHIWTAASLQLTDFSLFSVFMSPFTSLKHALRSNEFICSTVKAKCTCRLLHLFFHASMHPLYFPHFHYSSITPSHNLSFSPLPLSLTPIYYLSQSMQAILQTWQSIHTRISTTLCLMLTANGKFSVCAAVIPWTRWSQQCDTLKPTLKEQFTPKSKTFIFPPTCRAIYQSR